RDRTASASRDRAGAADYRQSRNPEGEAVMTDTIASRVTRVVSGSVHALLDAVENGAPEATMAQGIREGHRVIDEVRAELGRVEASKHLATTQLNKLNTDHEQLAAQIEAAIAQGREDLARA